MSRWHRENPELAGTSADPWMANEGHRQAHDELVRAGVIEAPEGDEFEGHSFCGSCYTLDPGDDDYCWSCGERL